MKYTTELHTAGFHHVRIEPLDPSIVRFALSVELDGYPDSVADEALSLYAALALTSTKSKNKEEIESYLKRFGIRLKVTSARARINFTGSVRSANVPQLIRLLKEILLTPKIQSIEFERKKKLALEDNRESRDNARRIASIAFSNLLYDRKNIMREALLDDELISIKKTTLKTVEAIARDILKGEWYFSIVSDLKTAKKFDPFLNILKKHSQAVEYSVAESTPRDSQSAFVTVAGKTNVEVRMGNIVPITPDHEDYIPLEFGFAVLGIRSGFSGRLMSTVREKEGLTYDIHAHLIERNRKNTVHWNIYAFFTARDLQKGLRSTHRELKAIIEKGITVDELSIFKEILLNQRILSHESNSTRLSFYHGLSLLGYTAEDEVTMTNRLRTLTQREVNAALKKYIDPENLVIAGAGPVTEEGVGITTK